MKKSSQPNIQEIIDRYRDRGFYQWLCEDIDIIQSQFTTVTDHWILSNYGKYEENIEICRVQMQESIYECVRCRSRYVCVRNVQSRRSDEGITTVYHCTQCGYSGKSINILR